MTDKNQQEVLLRVEHLSQHFKSLKAVDDISFDVKKGEVFGLVGESGCGKTTTGRSILRIYDITGGSIYFKGHRICAGSLEYDNAIKEARAELKKLGGDANATARAAELRQIIEKNVKARRLAKHDHHHSDDEYAAQLVKKLTEQHEAECKAAGNNKDLIKQLKRKYREEVHVARKTRLITKIQMIFQDPVASLNPRMTVQEIISEGLVINGIKDKNYIQEKVYEILELVGLTREHAGRYPHEFSGGQKQRIGIARSVIMQPDMIIADEPVSALDVSIQAQVINLLNELRERLGLTILFIAHDLSVVKYFSDRIGVMYYGRMVELASSDELFAHPLHPYTRSLLSSIPLPDPKSEQKRKRITYNPLESHDYSVDKPTMREIKPGHFVMCNDKEFAAYKAQLQTEGAI